MDTEIWKDIDGYEGCYQVSSHGRVRSLDRRVKRSANTTRLAKGRVMKQSPNGPYGYLFVPLKKNGSVSQKYVHRLVCEAFNGPCPDGMECSHADDDQSNNHHANLSWQTHAENIRMRGINGGDLNGERSGTSKLTEACVHIIIAMCNSGRYRQREIASMFDVKREAVSKIACGVRWKHLPRPLGGPRGHKKKATEKYWQKVEKALDSL